MKKRVLPLLLALVLLLSAVPAVNAEGEYQLTYAKYTDTTGEECARITGYTGTLPEKLVLPEQIDGYPVREILDGAFKTAPIKEVTLPGTIIDLSSNAFSNNEFLESAAFSEGTTCISHAFGYCRNLKTVKLPSSLKEIGEWAFASTALTEITIPEGVEVIRQMAFALCDQLEKIYLPHTLKEADDLIFGYESDLPENLSVYAYLDTPILDICLRHHIRIIDRVTGEPAPELYDTHIDGITYTVNPGAKTAKIIGCNPDEIGSVLVIPETVDGCSVTRIDNWGLDRLPCVGVILPDTLTYIADIAITAKDINTPLFLCMPDNEVFIDGNYKNCYVKFFFLPEHFSLKEECRENADRIFDAKCIGYEAHKSFINEDRLITVDGTPDDRLMLTNAGVFRLDGKEYTAIYLTTVNPMPSAIGGVPITRVAASCALTSSTIILGDFVRVVEDGAIVSSNEFGDVYITGIYVPDCIAYLPADFYPTSSDCTMYGTGGGYAEQYAKEHGLQFAAFDNTPFTDVAKDAWYYSYVHDIYWAGLMNGTSKTTFEPNGTTTRAMVVQVLFNLAGEEVGYYEIFKDVTYEDWFYHAVTWAYAAGVCNGTSKTTFSPNDPVTREQLAAFLYRFTTLCGVDCKADGDLSRFADQNQISAYARDAIAWAVGAGIINGKSPTTVAPRAYATRAEIAAMLCRLLDYIDANLAA